MMVISHTARILPAIIPAIANLIPVKSISLRCRHAIKEGKKVPNSSIGTGTNSGLYKIKNGATSIAKPNPIKECRNAPHTTRIDKAKR